MTGLVNHQRMVGRYLQTPIRAYRDADGRRVWLVGLVHHGERRYFRQLRTAVDELTAAGAVVHFESTGMTEAQIEAAGPSALEREAFTLMDANRALTLRLVAPRGWVDQFDGFSHPDERGPSGRGRSWPAGWERHDLTLIEVLRLEGVEAAVARLRHTNAVLTMQASSWLGRRMHLVQFTTLAMMQASGVRLPQPADSVILDARNDKAIADAQATPGDVVLLWGAAHLPGLGRRLQALGYTRTGETWHTVGRLPRRGTIALWVALRALTNLRHIPQALRNAKALGQAHAAAQAAACQEADPVGAERP